MQKIVFNGHYLTYIDTAIAEYWREIGLPYPHGYVERYGNDIYLRKATVEYLGSARYDDVLDGLLPRGEAWPHQHDLPFEIYREARGVCPGHRRAGLRQRRSRQHEGSAAARGAARPGAAIRARCAAGMKYWEDFKVGERAELGQPYLHRGEIIAFGRQYDPQPFHIDAAKAARQRRSAG